MVIRRPEFKPSLFIFPLLSGNSKVAWRPLSNKVRWFFKVATLQQQNPTLYLVITLFAHTNCTKRYPHLIQPLFQAFGGYKGRQQLDIRIYYIVFMWVDHCCKWSSFYCSSTEPSMDQKLEQIFLGMFQQKEFCQNFWIKTSQERLGWDKFPSSRKVLKKLVVV